jgi:hypothetical protein
MHHRSSSVSVFLQFDSSEALRYLMGFPTNQAPQ